MVRTTLYSADGRMLYEVLVPLPMPASLTYAGMLFVWNAGHTRYEESAAPGPVPAKPLIPGSGYPEATKDQFPR